jgi:hypothetical protein
VLHPAELAKAQHWLTQWRPLLTYLDIHNAAVTPDMTLAYYEAMCQVAYHAYTLRLFICVQSPANSPWLRSPMRHRLARLSDIKEAGVDLCAYGSPRPRSTSHDQARLVLLTNAPWIVETARQCQDPACRRRPIRDSASESALWPFAKAHGVALKRAVESLAWSRPPRPVETTEQGFTRVSRAGLTGAWPDVPYTFLTGVLETERRSHVRFSGATPQMPPPYGR